MLRAAAAAPPLQSTETRLLCGVGLQIWVCALTSMPSPYRSLLSPFQAHCYALQICCFWSTQELMLYENHQAVHNLLLQLVMCFSFHFPAAAVKFPLSLTQISAVTRPLRFLPFTSFSRSIFSVHSNALSPSEALPPLQSH